MKQLTGYIFRTVINTSLLVFFVFLSLVLFISLMVELIEFKPDYGFSEILVYVLASLPSKLYLSMPIVLLLGALLGMARLATTSELVVMLASGVSKFQIIRTVLLSSGVLLIFSFMLGEWLGPIGERFAYDHKSRTYSARSFQPLTQVWVKSRDAYIFIQNLSPDKKTAFNILRFQFNSDNTIKSASYAKKATLGDEKWEVRDVKTTAFKRGGDQVQYLSEATWPVVSNLRVLNRRGVLAYQLPLWDLHQIVKHKKINGLSARREAFTFWQRVWAPISTLIMIAISVPFIFGSLRERSIGGKIMIGVTIALAFYVLNAFFAPVSDIFKIPPILSASSVSLLLILGVLLFFLWNKEKG